MMKSKKNVFVVEGVVSKFGDYRNSDSISSDSKSSDYSTRILRVTVN